MRLSGLPLAIALITLAALVAPALAQPGSKAVPPLALDETNPKKPDVAARQAKARELAQRAKALKQQGLSDMALDALREALQTYPSFPMAHNEIGVLLADKGDLLAAEASFRNAVELDPQLAEAWANLAEAQRRQRKLDDAAKTYQTFLEQRPKDADAYYALASIYTKQNKQAEALWAMERVLQHHYDPQSRVVKDARKRAAELIKLGVEATPPQAVMVAEPTDPEDPDPGKGAQPAEGPPVEMTEAAGEPGPLPAHAGDDAFRRQRYVKALKAYQNAVAERPEDVILLYKVGATHAVMGNYHAALRWWRRALALDPGRAFIVHQIGLVAVQLHKRDQLALAPVLGEGGAEAKAREALLDGRPAEALSLLAGQTSSDASFLRGEAALRLGDLERAERNFAAVLEFSPDDNAALGGLAEALMRQADETKKAKAEEKLAKYLGDQPVSKEEYVVLRSAEAASRIRFGGVEEPGDGGEGDPSDDEGADEGEGASGKGDPLDGAFDGLE